MNFWFLLYCVVLLVGVVLAALVAIIDVRVRYDITIDGELIRGCQCEFHDHHGYLEITDPETENVTIFRYKTYSVERVYLKGRKEK